MIRNVGAVEGAPAPVSGPAGDPVVTDALTRGARGAGVTIIGQGLKVLIQFTSVVALSRLLPPEDFGLIAMVAVFVAFGETIRDFGMTLIGLQRQELSHQEASNLFWVNTALGFVTGALLAASAGLLVGLYQEPRLWWVVPAIAPTLFINGMAAQLRVQLVRSMRFALIACLDVGVQVLVLTVTIVLAVLHFGYWSLVLASLVGALFSLVAPAIATRWVPTRPRRDGSSRTLLGDGAAFGVAHFLTYLSSNVDTLMIGMRWGPASVGLYNRGYQLLALPIQQLLGPLTQVVIPTVNGVVKQGQSAASVLARIQFGLGSLVIWLFAVTGAIADWLIPFALGEAWRPVAPIFRILAFGGFFWAFSQVNYWRVIVENQGRQLVRFNLVTKLTASALIVVGSFISLEAVAWAVVVGLGVTWPLALIWFGRVAAWDSWQQFKSGLRLMVPGALSSVAGLAIMRLFPTPDGPLAAAVAVLAVTSLYVAGVLVVPGGWREARGVASMAVRLVPRRQRAQEPTSPLA